MPNPIIRSSIRPELKLNTLLNGTLIAVAGVALLVAGGTFMPERLLSTWGFLIWIVALFMIAYGLIPYRKLTRLELKPFEIHNEGDRFLFKTPKGIVLTLPKKELIKSQYVTLGKVYGIAIWLKEPKKLPDTLRNDLYQNKIRKAFGCDLFLPYFSEKGYSEFQAAL